MRTADGRMAHAGQIKSRRTEDEQVELGSEEICGVPRDADRVRMYLTF